PPRTRLLRGAGRRGRGHPPSAASSAESSKVSGPPSPPGADAGTRRARAVVDGYPLTTPTGASLATFRARPAPSHASTTASTSLYASGVSSVRPRADAPRTTIPAACSSARNRAAVVVLTAWWRLSLRPAPWQAEANAGPSGTPASTYDPAPIEPGTSTGWPTGRRSGGRSS